MLEVLSRNWWALVLRGVVAVLFGIAAFVWPGLTVLTLVLLFGAYALVDGIFAVVAALRGPRETRPSWTVLLEGLIGILAGIAAFVWPGITALALLYLIAAWAIVTGIIEIAAAIRLRSEIQGEWLLVLGGIISVLFGLYIALFPGAGALTVVWLIGAYAIVFGVVVIALGLRLRGLHQGPASQAPRSVEGLP